MGRTLDLTGQRFGRLVVASKTGDKGKRGEIFWYCLCDCGAESVVRAANLKSGGTVSCGCAQVESCKTHGMTKTRTFKSWESMKQRCLNQNAPDFKRYGGRGIKICARWVDGFANFFEDMGERPIGASLDRKDVNGNYDPENCRWATRSEQQRNKSNSVLIEWKGDKKCAADWSEIVGISSKIICGRISAGWNVEDALTKPNRKKRI